MDFCKHFALQKIGVVEEVIDSNPVAPTINSTATKDGF